MPSTFLDLKETDRKLFSVEQFCFIWELAYCSWWVLSRRHSRIIAMAACKTMGKMRWANVHMFNAPSSWPSETAVVQSRNGKYDLQRFLVIGLHPPRLSSPSLSELMRELPIAPLVVLDTLARCPGGRSRFPLCPVLPLLHGLVHTLWEGFPITWAKETSFSLHIWITLSGPYRNPTFYFCFTNLCVCCISVCFKGQTWDYFTLNIQPPWHFALPRIFYGQTDEN